MTRPKRTGASWFFSSKSVCVHHLRSAMQVHDSSVAWMEAYMRCCAHGPTLLDCLSCVFVVYLLIIALDADCPPQAAPRS